MTTIPRRADHWRHSPVVAVLLALVFGSVAPMPLRAQSACPSASHAASPIDTWLRATGGHPLVGTILRGTEPLMTAADVCSPSPLLQLQSALTAHLAGGGLLLLGEVHDNGAQHALRGFLLDAIATDLTRHGHAAPALVFEHIRTDQAGALTPSPAPTPADARELARDLLTRLDWDKSGWPAADLFLPIFEAAIAHKLPILPGHPTRAEVRDVARRGLQALPADTSTRLGLDVPLPGPLASALLDELEASHCGLMPRSAFANMALAQRYRDTHLASAVVAAASRYGSAILFAGNGHVRRDRGVPWDLARMAPERKVVAVAFLEVEDGQIDPGGYVPRDPAGTPAVDYVVLTPRTARADPCDAMRAQFKKK
ncbi:MAG: ChaN family lipoprotein [Hyphomicrobiaceae bacterium]